MNRRIFVLFAFLFTGIAHGAIDDGLGHSLSSTPASPRGTPVAPMQRPPVAPAPMAMPAAGEGKVLSVIHGAGYSYLELESGGQHFWVAATKVDVKEGSRVRFDQNVVMENFTSKFLKRTFDRIIFATSVTPVP